MSKITHLLSALAATIIVVVTASAFATDIGVDKPTTDQQGARSTSVDAIPPYQPRFGRKTPVIAIVGENGGTETTDFIIPFSILSQSGVAEVVTVGTQEGPIKMWPALTTQPDATTTAFDARYLEGADYVIVPAVRQADDPHLLAWIQAQAAKGATVVGVCDGVFVLGNAGLLEGRRATGHWASHGYRESHFKSTQWLTNTRYVADGNVITTAGITASIPASLALVEAIAGHRLAEVVAREIGVSRWSAEHNSDAFKVSARPILVGISNYLAFWSHRKIGVPVIAGVDELALALTADAYSRTLTSRAITVSTSQEIIRTRRGLMVVPDKTIEEAGRGYLMLPPLRQELPATALEGVLDEIASAYGSRTAAFVALQLEYSRF